MKVATSAGTSLCTSCAAGYVLNGSGTACVVADSDGDGVPDDQDGCPADPGKSAPGQCGCGTPDTDSDGDGRANCLETCTP